MTERILVVDDEITIAQTLSMILAGAGYEVRAAYSPKAALEIAAGFRPDVLITDFAMPQMTGLELAAQISQELPACRIIVFTGQSEVREPDLVRVPKYHLLMKPVPPEEFLRLVKSPGLEEIKKLCAKPRALCVDDVEPHRYSVSRLLQLAGFDVLECGTGKAALAQAVTRPDVIVLDVGLPDINGIEVCRRLKKRKETASIPVLHLTSSHLDDTLREESHKAGAYEYICAPFDPDYLLARTRSAAQLGYLQG